MLRLMFGISWVQDTSSDLSLPMTKVRVYGSLSGLATPGAKGSLGFGGSLGLPGSGSVVVCGMILER